MKTWKGRAGQCNRDRKMIGICSVANSKTIFKSLFGISALFMFSGAACAQSMEQESEQLASELMFSCPTDGALRVADNSSVSRFQSLRGCADSIIVAPPEAITRPVSPVQIETYYEDDDPFNRAAPDRNGSAKTILAKGRGNKKISKKPGEPELTRVALHSRPIGDDETRMITIAPDAQEISAWEEVAAAVPTGGMAENVSQQTGEGGAILTLRPRSYSTSYDALIAQVATRYAIDPLLLHAVIKQESGYRPTIRSHAGAVGLMQIMPGTGRMLGVQPAHLTDPSRNVDAGARLLRQLHGRLGGNFDLVLAAYNAGEGAVRKYGNRIPPYRETQNYVRSVKAHYVKLMGENGYSGVRF